MINTVSCTPDEAKELIKRLSSLKLSFMLWGATGVGKSETVRQLAIELDADLRDIRLCQKQPTDIGGLPALDHESGATVFYLPAFLAPHPDGKAVVLFFDEISLAPDDTKGAVLGIMEERQQADIKLPDNWIIVAAGNRPEDLANARNLGAAANRRLLHIVIERCIGGFGFPKSFSPTSFGRSSGANRQTRTLSASGIVGKSVTNFRRIKRS